ncbi:hypothetical protein DSM104299_02160 [Baekduia alba]|uniref:hypothetical protein n=1 Tax=Baekduia alba TaxID=2997333 RepID=UPI0023409418|nr:hypothetical protein [Baekduia alba]WCB93447.1 hypothetical protein DSM104299_02160 [Baekduia alba]
MTGSQDAELVMKRLSVTGHAASTLDGKSIGGPRPDMLNGGACPTLLPKKPALRVKAKRTGEGAYRLMVTASIAGMGASESAVDARPVSHATVAVGGQATTATDAHGVATVTVHGTRARVTVTAGTTLKPALVSLNGR